MIQWTTANMFVKVKKTQTLSKELKDTKRESNGNFKTWKKKKKPWNKKLNKWEHQNGGDQGKFSELENGTVEIDQTEKEKIDWKNNRRVETTQTSISRWMDYQCGPPTQ